MFTKLGFTWDASGRVKKHIEQWVPEDCASEKDYERSLLEFLQTNADGVEVVAQWGLGRQRVDIVVGRKVAIELKMDLKTVSEMERTKGQLHAYAKEFAQTFLVLCGTSDPQLVHCLQEYAGELTGWSFMDSQVDVLEK